MKITEKICPQISQQYFSIYGIDADNNSISEENNYNLWEINKKNILKN